MKKSVSQKQLDALKIVSEGRFYPVLVEEEDGWYARWAPVENLWVDALVRNASVNELTENAEDLTYFTVNDAWLAALRSRSGLVKWNAEECKKFSKELHSWSKIIEQDNEARERLIFKIKNSSDDTHALFLYVKGPKGEAEYRALGFAAKEWMTLLGLKWCEQGPEGERCLGMELSALEAEDFIHNGASKLKAAGYKVEGVALRADVTSTIELEGVEVEGIGEDESADVEKRNFKTKLVIKVDGQTVTEEEIRFLLDQGSSLVFFRDHWIEIDRQVLKNALAALEKLKKDDNPNLLAFAMGIGHVDKLEIESLAAHGWVRGLVNSIAGAKNLGCPDKIEGLEAQLREYQRLGVGWLSFMTSNGFGALLADDMGLGKTIQTIAWILSDRAHRTPALILTPLTLVANWKHELKNFAPSLSEKEVKVVNYHRFIHEYSAYAAKPWSTLIVDEAQILKNPDTQLSRAVRALSPRNRILLTGTPIENSVEDLWSLEDFLNPGFLGDRASFKDRFLRPLNSNPQSSVAARLKHAMEPFIMRRLKSDERVVSELGDKREIREFCPLDVAARQAYEEAIDDFKLNGESQGDILALITRLKLICDSASKEARLLELMENIFERGESVIIFTQFATVGKRLKALLDKRFGADFPYIHGSLGPKSREEAIKRFNRGAGMVEYGPDPSALLLTLKSGGVGLNLVKATHVIHFDRWWNPAVESQATDRAHRIGQTNDVWVHLFISPGTLEEHIDEILQRKQSLQGLLSNSEAFYRAISLTDV